MNSTFPGQMDCSSSTGRRPLMGKGLPWNFLVREANPEPLVKLTSPEARSTYFMCIKKFECYEYTSAEVHFEKGSDAHKKRVDAEVPGRIELHLRIKSSH